MSEPQDRISAGSNRIARPLAKKVLACTRDAVKPISRLFKIFQGVIVRLERVFKLKKSGLDSTLAACGACAFSRKHCRANRDIELSITRKNTFEDTFLSQCLLRRRADGSIHFAQAAIYLRRLLADWLPFRRHLEVFQMASCAVLNHRLAITAVVTGIRSTWI